MAKICLVSNTAWSFVRFREDLLRAFVQSGHQVLLAAPADDQVAQLTAMGLAFRPLRHLAGKGLNPFADLLLYRELRQLYALEKPDVIIQYTIKPNIYGTLAAHVLRIPVIAVITGLGYTFINKNLVSLIASGLYRLALSKASRVWFLNQDDQQLFVRRKLVKPSKAAVIPGEGVNCTETFNPALFPAPPSATGAELRFLWVGRLLYDKGIREYAEAARQLKEKYPTIRFLVLGYLHANNPTALAASELEKWVSDGIVEYLGSTTDVRPFLLGTDCVVLPSYREGMSTTLQEGAAMERPLVASDIPGCRELIDHGVNGFLCEPRNTGSLVQQLEAFIRLPVAEQRAMGRHGREKMIREFSVNRILQIYADAIQEITGKRDNFTQE